MKKQKGQILLALILVMTIALAIGLSVIQKSLVDVSTSTKVEQSSRAFSTAEAGIERALQIGSTTVIFPENDSTANVTDTGLIPCIPGSVDCAQASGSQQAPLEYPPLAKEEVAHVWLANFDSITNPPATYYNQTTLDVYWGDSSTDKAALELTLVYYDGTKYTPRKWYLDQTDRSNGFEQVTSCAGYTIPDAVADSTTCANSSVTYQCKKRLGDSTGVNNGSLSSGLMLLRARLLYNTNSQPLAVQATGSGGTCTGATGNGCYLPPQARSIISTGTSGETQRKVKVCQVNKVVPPYFDYAIFSVGEISK